MPALETPDEQRWRLAIESASIGVWDLDPRAELVHYSPQWKARLGFAASDVADSTAFWRSRVHPDDLAPMLDALRSHIDGFVPTYEMQFRLRLPGGYRQVLSRGRVVERNERGEALRVVGTMVELETARPQRRVPKVAGQWSHELRTPLHTILGFSQLMSERLGSLSAEDQRRYLAHIQQAGWQLLSRVDDLLDAAARQGEPPAVAHDPSRQG